MTNLSRARTAKSEADREMHSHLAEAMRALAKAEAVVGMIIRLASREDPISSHRASRYVTDIRRAQSLIQSIGSLVPGYNLKDPDLLSEDAKTELFHQRIAEAKAKKKAEVEG